jgi:hypothetical protein
MVAMQQCEFVVAKTLSGNVRMLPQALPHSLGTYKFGACDSLRPEGSRIYAVATALPRCEIKQGKVVD